MNNEFGHSPHSSTKSNKMLRQQTSIINPPNLRLNTLHSQGGI